ncbi:TcmI family type II polyketide cyclase [Actinomadura rubrisoli]|uniref:TcmI family type II polyketide cyclase n=1 Tax=Actinomadura rubrisoli TaxID=2530368 RepID=A0A4R5BUN4_9ACTN|nr:TcmI family type II polyketide cyclase [Actinomadura rubrisoli]TDD89855.1 TcmI family type II polyketide cyclase [Actinomadura rubrisoli]
MASRPTHRALMIRRIEPADLTAVARVFQEHDRTPLPSRIGVRRRTLLHYHGLYMHLVEGGRGFEDNLYSAGDDPLFREVDHKLAGLLAPYDRGRPSMREARAEEFYRWTDDAPSATYRLFLEIRVHEGRGEEFEGAWQRMAAVVGGQPANLAQSLSRDRRDPHTYYVVSDWTDEESFQRFSRAPEHQALAETIRTLGTTVRMTGMQIREQQDS